MTARNHGLQSATLNHLDSVGICFNHDLFPQKPQMLKGNDRVRTYRGIVFLDGRNKGEFLKAFLDEVLQTRPKKVVFIDDKLKNVKHVEEAMAAEGISFVGVRYGYLDEKVNSLNMDLADIQKQYFNMLLNDETAEAILNLGEG